MGRMKVAFHIWSPNTANAKVDWLFVADWFPGWAAHGGYNRQPNDDGLSAQDCVELRRAYSPPPPAPPTPPSLAASHRWNDRDCGAPNFYVCERPLADGELLT